MEPEINPLVSIIVPVYNAEDYISDAIYSVLDQSYTNWELILIDDGSTDDTKSFILPFLKDSRIQYFYKQNGGQSTARNKGIKHARGYYLAFLDADDIWDSDRLASQLGIIQTEDVSLVFSKLRCVARNGEYLNKNKGNGTGVFQGFTALFLLAAGQISIPNSSVLVTKESVEEVNKFNESDEARNIEDYHLWFRMLLAGYKFYGINKVTGAYRIHENQTTYKDPGQSRKIIVYLSKLSGKYPQKEHFFKFLILQRLSMYYKQHDDKQEARAICLRIFYSNSCIDSYMIEKYFINAVDLTVYLRFRKLLIRRFRKFDTFTQRIND